jgi:hypothetical protein
MRRDCRTALWSALACLFLPDPTSAQTPQPVTLTVSGMADVFAAGLSSVPPLTGGGGVLPPFYSFNAASHQILTFSSVTGLVNAAVCCYPWAGPDGITYPFPTFVGPLGGITSVRLKVE